MSEADSASPSPRRGRNGASDGSWRAAQAFARTLASRSPSSSTSSRAEGCRTSRCWAVAAILHAATAQQREVLQTSSLDEVLLDGERLALGPRVQRGQLEQLQVARDAVGD